MNVPGGPADPKMLRVLIATQSAHTGAALASLLGDPADISYEIVALASVLPLNLLLAQNLGVDVVLLDLEPWPVKALCTTPPTMGERATPLELVLVVALAHFVEESMHRQCREAGVDYLLDRTADLGRLQSVMLDYAQARRSKTLLAGGAL